MKAWQLIEGKGRWTKGELAKDAAGNAVPPESSKAVCWCIVGAIDAAYPSRLENLIAYGKAWDSLPNGIAEWNDKKSTTQKQAVALLKKLDI